LLYFSQQKLSCCWGQESCPHVLCPSFAVSAEAITEGGPALFYSPAAAGFAAGADQYSL